MRNNSAEDSAIKVGTIADKRGWSLGDSLFRFLSAFLLVLGMSGSVYTMMSNCEAVPFIVIAAIVILCGVLTFCSGTSFSGIVYGSVLLVSLVSAFVLRDVLTSGMAGLMNALSDVITMRTGRITLKIVVQGDTVLAQTVAAVLLGVGLCLLVCLIVNLRRVAMTAILICVMAAGYVFGYLVPDRWLLVFATGLSLCFLHSGFLHARNYKSMLVASGIVAVLALFVGAVGTSAFSTDKTMGLRGCAERWTDALVYGGNRNSMPEGLLSELPAWTPGENTALLVSMESPQKLYLRGYVGEMYAGDRWEVLGEKDTFDASALFYWLHQGGFYGQAQIAGASAVLGEHTQETLKLEVRNVSAYGKWAYLPYGLADSSALDAAFIGDARVRAESTSYAAEYLQGSVPEWYSLQVELANSQMGGEEAVQEYLSLEQAYGVFARENYLQISDAVIRILNEDAEEESGSLSLAEIKARIRETLDEKMRYSEETFTHSGGTDFFEYVLQRSGHGYSVHYATLATLMLRWYGVPARYVEGYYISSDEAARWDGMVKESFAHAWTEYYLDGVGWIPFEVTPGYIDEEELIRSHSILEKNSELLQGSDSSFPREYSIQARPQPNVINPESGTDSARDYNAPEYRNIYVWLLLFAALLALTMFLLKRRRKFVGVKKRMENEAVNRNAAAQLFGYAVFLMGHAGMGVRSGDSAELYGAISEWYRVGDANSGTSRGQPRRMNEFMELAAFSSGGNVDKDVNDRNPDQGLEVIYALNNKALFSDRDVTEEERRLMQVFTADTLARCVNQWDVRRRLYYKWIKCIY